MWRQNKSVKLGELNIKIAAAVLNTQTLDMIQQITKVSKKEKKFDENLIKRFSYTYKIFNHDINKVISLLRKGVYPCEYITRTQKVFVQILK